MFPSLKKYTLQSGPELVILRVCSCLALLQVQRPLLSKTSQERRQWEVLHQADHDAQDAGAGAVSKTTSWHHIFTYPGLSLSTKSSGTRHQRSFWSSTAPYRYSSGNCSMLVAWPVLPVGAHWGFTEAPEADLAGLFQGTSCCAIHARRVTSFPEPAAALRLLWDKHLACGPRTAVVHSLMGVLALEFVFFQG